VQWKAGIELLLSMFDLPGSPHRSSSLVQWKAGIELLLSMFRLDLSTLEVASLPVRFLSETK
jgi:hypothetical protein